jgi:hypothetical protein
MATTVTSCPDRCRRASKTMQERVAVALLAIMVFFAAGCATHWPGLTTMADEGWGVIHRGKLTTEPEAKVHVAEAILTHADKYDQLINRSTNSRYIAEAQRIQRNEREAAALLLREAADDYVARQDIEQASVVHHLIVESFGPNEYEAARQSATAH